VQDFYPSENTSFYDLGEQPIMNTIIDLVLRDIPNIETIIESIKVGRLKNGDYELFKDNFLVRSQRIYTKV
jgi:hypothetical protein